MTREEYLKKLIDNKNSIYNSVINDVNEKIENVDIHERCNLNEEQAFLITSNSSGNYIIRDLEEKYPFLTFSLTNWNTLISWKLKEEK